MLARGQLLAFRINSSGKDMVRFTAVFPLSSRILPVSRSVYRTVPLRENRGLGNTELDRLALADCLVLKTEGHRQVHLQTRVAGHFEQPTIGCASIRMESGNEHAGIDHDLVHSARPLRSSS